MQFLDAEDLLVDEEDDIFGEGKHIFLAGAILVCFDLTLWETCLAREKDLSVLKWWQQSILNEIVTENSNLGTKGIQSQGRDKDLSGSSKYLFLKRLHKV